MPQVRYNLSFEKFRPFMGLGPTFSDKFDCQSNMITITDPSGLGLTTIQYQKVVFPMNFGISASLGFTYSENPDYIFSLCFQYTKDFQYFGLASDQSSITAFGVKFGIAFLLK